MNSVRITKKGIILMVVVLVLLSAGVGFGLWRVNQDQQLSGTDTSAAGQGGADGCKGDYTCDSCAQGDQTAKCWNRDPVTKQKLGVCGNKVCDGNGYGRYHCCDGKWAIGTDGNSACGGAKNYSKCEKTSQQCTCKTYGACGSDCTFPAGTKQKVEDLAKAHCSTVMAFCVMDKDGNTKITYGDPGKCDPKVCNNPTATGECKPNLCDGGGLISPTKAQPFNKGGAVVFKGYAFDSDGINATKINISVDGKVVGKAKVVDACGAAGDATICNKYKAQKPVIWSYNYTSPGGNHSFVATWEDSKGVTGAKCKTASSIVGQVVQDNWVVTKVGVPQCINTDPENPQARINYTITVRNSATQSKNITKIVDTPDAKVLPAYILISTINPGGTLNGNVITWSLTGTAATFTAGQSKTYKYSIQIPKSAFGTYVNSVVVTPETGSAIQVSNTTIAICKSDGTPIDVPDTGLFDSGFARVGLGLILIGFGFAYLYSDNFQRFVTNTLGKVTGPLLSEDVRTDLRRKKFERKVVKK